MRQDPRQRPARNTIFDKLKRLFRRPRREEHPDDPYAYVTAPKKPRPRAGSAAVAELEP